ncbi:MAG: DUF3536 domain-containing protein [Candidatus Eisenbacteria bacterium]|nr:DUF3536 domain-containing protein [Candidatus Eisenbacteria bacterium]
MERYLCIHGHFYQPPRENAWLEAVEVQDSAAPFHDWNERIAAECYAPNAAARVLDEEGRLVRVVNNYSRISFNFGPTLLTWLEKERPGIVEHLRAAYEESRRVYSGHGSAMAQAYNHVIMPLANRRDKLTQILWGIRDFQYRFGRKPEGMWLPETAVDTETLALMAAAGIRFTILAPEQARRVRPPGGGPWEDVDGQKIDPTMGYRVNLSQRQRINVFFYDGPISRAVAFEQLLESGEALASRLMAGFSEGREGAQLVNIAADGETYGHHHRFGEMALAYALQKISAGGQVRLTNYGEFLDKHPPTHEVQIHENSAWSCSHGVERWRSDCGCHTGGQDGWRQTWRAPLRLALEWLRDSLIPHFEAAASKLLKDPWAARDAYIDVVLDRSRPSVEGFLSEHAVRELTAEEKVTVLKLMELQRNAMFMFTSCGWFFADLSGIETVQVIQYAARALQLAREALRIDLEPEFLWLLEAAKSNIPGQGTGRQIYERTIRPTMVNLEQVAAHYAISRLFEEDGETERIHCYRTHSRRHEIAAAGRTRLSVGVVGVTNELTWESDTLGYAVFHQGDQNLNAGVRPFRDDEACNQVAQELTTAFEKADFTQVIRLLDHHFGTAGYSLKSLFRDDQRRVMKQILEAAAGNAELLYRRIYEDNAPLLNFLVDSGIPRPKAIQAAAEIALNGLIREALEDGEFNGERLGSLWDAMQSSGVALEKQTLGFTLEEALDGVAKEMLAEPEEVEFLQKLERGAAVLEILPIETDLSVPQLACYELLQGPYLDLLRRSRGGEADAARWVEAFHRLADRLRVRVDRPGR